MNFNWVLMAKLVCCRLHLDLILLKKLKYPWVAIRSWPDLRRRGDNEYMAAV